MAESRQKYGLITAISMVVGAVIGSGVFFKTENINLITGGSVLFSVIAWGIGALVMIMCLLAFASITGKKGAEGGLYSMAKVLSGEKYAYTVGFFMAVVYYPSLISVLSYLSAKYTLLTVGGEENVFLCVSLSCAFLVASFLQNALSPRFSGKVQVVTTALKLVPLIFMIALGIPKGMLHENITAGGSVPFKTAFFPSVTATLFAYEGWISATSIGKNLKNSRRNLPLALLIGGTLISAVYVLYYLGIMGAVKSETLINYGKDGINIAFSNILGRWGNLLTAFVAISCYGALNALVMGCGHATEEIFEKKPTHAYSIGFIISLLWLVYLIGHQENVLARFRFDSTELPVVTIYALYIPIFLGFAKSEKNLKTTILCAGGICASLFAVLCGILAHTEEIVNYVTMLSSIMIFGSLFYKSKQNP
ncbi:MAG: APC family permease [Clostridia bacterium]|nr:APC family permease [Clostridia bacterium]